MSGSPENLNVEVAPDVEYLDFDTYYNEHLEPVLVDFEQERRRVNKKITLASVFSLLAATAICIPLLLNGLAVFGVIVLVICIAVPVVVGGNARKAYSVSFKNNVIGRIATFVDESIQYEPAGCVSSGEYHASRIFKQGVDRYNGEDLFIGRHGKTDFRFSEIHSEYKTESTDSKGNRTTSWHTIFEGVFFIADFHKEFHGLTVILPDNAEKTFGRLGQMFQKTFKHSGELIKLEDPAFEKEFVVYGSDQIEARYILSHSMMQRILDFKKKTRSKMHLSFHHSNVYLAISSARDRFEPRLMRSVLDRELCREYMEDLLFSIDIIDDLNLNTRIWTKE